MSNLREEFGCGAQTNRAKLLTVLSKNIGAQVPMSKMAKSLYGDANAPKGPLRKVIGSLDGIIKAKRLPFVLKKTREDGETFYGLHAKTKRTKKASENGN